MSDHFDSRFAETRINPAGGFDIVPNEVRSLTIGPSAILKPANEERFRVSKAVLGKLERVAHAKFELRRLSKCDIESWKTAQEEQFVALAQSVQASSQIENEGLAAEELGLFLNAVTKAEEPGKSEELSARSMAMKSIYETYLWALTQDRKSFLDYDLVLEIHRRMFSYSEPIIAGKLKSEEVWIKGGGYDVRTLPVNHTQTHLAALCERTESRLQSAARFADESLLLITAEFILDFLAIHPFADGNGRTARLLSTYLLERSGYHFARFYSLDKIILDSRANYYEVLFKSQYDWWTEKEDLTPWIKYYVDSVYRQYREAELRVSVSDQRTSAF